MIVIDYSCIAIAAITGFREDLKRESEHVENLARHVIISTIKNYKRQFSKEFGNEIIIACDSAPYWRKDVFEYYKYKRKKNREESDIPWDLIFKCMRETKEDLKQHFPWKVIEVPGAEADDILAVMAQNIAVYNNDSPLDDAPEKTLLLTKDKDSKQLLTHPNIRMWSPYDKKFVALEESSKKFLRRLILTGDAGDGIPNVFSPADSFYTGTRQKAATEKKMLPMLEADNMLDAAPDEFTRNRIIENTRLIAFNAMPKNIRDKIINAYDVPPNGNKMSVLKYFASKDMRLLMEDIDQF
jgi:5'-3' exonuclease, N-terminal resolvase-like domain/T4 RNase H, C terminal